MTPAPESPEAKPLWEKLRKAKDKKSKKSKWEPVRENEYVKEIPKKTEDPEILGIAAYKIRQIRGIEIKEYQLSEDDLHILKETYPNASYTINDLTKLTGWDMEKTEEVTAKMLGQGIMRRYFSLRME